MLSAVIGLGSNLGERQNYLTFALNALKRDGVRVVRRSPFYETEPWGFKEQPRFINAVALIETDLNPRELLYELQALENTCNRVRTEEHYGPRTLDLDILDIKGLLLADPELTLPHPRLQLRAFVLKPWYALDKDYVLADGRRIRELLEALPPEELQGVNALNEEDYGQPSL